MMISVSSLVSLVSPPLTSSYFALVAIANNEYILNAQ
jgi:hypothetical protein